MRHHDHPAVVNAHTTPFLPTTSRGLSSRR